MQRPFRNTCGRANLSPDLADVHYRLGQAYVHTKQTELAQQELQVYQRLRAEHLAEVDKQRADIRQFVYSAKGWAGGEVIGLMWARASSLVPACTSGTLAPTYK